MFEVLNICFEMLSFGSAVSVPETSQPFSTNPAESTREAPPTLSSSGVETPTPSSTSTAFTSSTISLANFGAPGAGAKPGMFLFLFKLYCLILFMSLK